MMAKNRSGEPVRPGMIVRADGLPISLPMFRAEQRSYTGSICTVLVQAATGTHPSEPQLTKSNATKSASITTCDAVDLL